MGAIGFYAIYSAIASTADSFAAGCYLFYEMW